jgi:MFS family permease
MKCRHCGSAITIPLSPSQESETDDEPRAQEEQRPRARTSAKAGLRKVSLGLLVLLVAAAASVLFSGGSFLWNFVSSFLPAPAMDAADLSAAVEQLLASISRFLVVSFLVNLLKDLATLAGYALCCFVPPRFGRRSLAVTALALGAIGVAIDTTVQLVTWSYMRRSTEPVALLAKSQEISRRLAAEKDPAKRPEIQQELDRTRGEQRQDLEKRLREMQEQVLWYPRIQLFGIQLRMLLHAVQYLAFAFFLMGLARSLGASVTAESCLNLIKLTAVLVLVQVIVQMCSGVGLMSPLLGLWLLSWVRVVSSVFMVVGPIVTLLGLAQAVWFVLIVYEVRKSVNQRASRPARRKERLA